MSLKTTETGSVILAYDGDDNSDVGQRRVRTFYCSRGQVFEHCIGRDREVAYGLAHDGWFLTATDATLADVIRRAYRAMRASERRDAARFF